MSDDVIDLLVISFVVGHEPFLQFHLGSERLELLNEPYRALHMRRAVGHTWTERHLFLDIGICAVGTEGWAGNNGLLFTASR